MTRPRFTRSFTLADWLFAALLAALALGAPIAGAVAIANGALDPLTTPATPTNGGKA